MYESCNICGRQRRRHPWPSFKTYNARDPRIGAVSFSRNFGKEIAIAAGLDHARGEAVVIMDADLQHPPEAIETFVARWREGYPMSTANARARAATTGSHTARLRPAVLPAVRALRRDGAAGGSRRLSTDRPQGRRGPALARRARPLLQGPVRLDRLSVRGRPLHGRGAPARRLEMEFRQAVPLRLRRHHVILDRSFRFGPISAGSSRFSPWRPRCSSWSAP